MLKFDPEENVFYTTYQEWDIQVMLQTKRPHYLSVQNWKYMYDL